MAESFMISIREWKGTLSFGLVLKWDTTMTTNFFFFFFQSKSHLALSSSPSIYTNRVSTIYNTGKMENTLTNSKEEMGRDQRTTNIWLMLFNLLPRKKYRLQMKSCKFRIWGPTESTKLKMRDHSFLLRKHRCILHQCPWTWAEYIYMAREIYRIHAYNPQREGEREREGYALWGFC